MRKAVILFLYGIALFIVLRRWYAQGNSGLPNPRVITPTTYLYSILALAADFAYGIPVVIAAGLTLSLYWNSSNKTVAAPSKKPVTPIPSQNTVKPPIKKVG
jgi:hypothetical protein